MKRSHPRILRMREPSARYALDSPVLVDSNVLIDVINADNEWFEWSAQQLEAPIDEGRAVINPIIYAEIASAYERIEMLEGVVGELGLQREALPWEAAFLAGHAFKRYRRLGGNRRSPLPDFYVGAHAAVGGYALLTRDTGRYREYFPRLRIISPS